MWVGGPPNPIQPIRPHSRRIVVSGTGSRAGAAACAGSGGTAPSALAPPLVKPIPAPAAHPAPQQVGHTPVHLGRSVPERWQRSVVIAPDAAGSGMLQWM